MSKKLLSAAFAIVTGALVVQPAMSNVVNAAPPVVKKVTICHRTHSVTNPYVRITVAESSIGNGASKHGGVKHDTYSSVLFPGGKPVPNVFNSAVTYTPATEKKWGDIIPNVYTDGTAFTGAGAGTNYSGIGIDIYNGTNGKAGVCKAMNARDFYETEKANNVPTQEILDDLEESKESDEFASALSACGGSFSNCTDPSKLGTTSITIDSTTTTVAAGGTSATTPKTPATLPAGVTLAAGKGALQVNIWVDSNRNGSKGTSEKSMKGVTVTIVGPNNETKTATTDSVGLASFLDLTPGSWSVTSVLSTDGYEKVYDSDGTADWATTLSVTEGQVASAEFAAATAIAASTKSVSGATTLAATGTDSGILALLAVILLSVGLALVQSRRRRSAGI